MDKVSIVIPSRNEKYLNKTIDDLFAKASQDIEVIAVLDGKPDYPLPKKRDNLTLIKKPKPEGLRPALKDASYKAKGKYLMKVDAHTMVSEGFDEVLKRDCADDWVVVSRYYKLDPDKWEIGKNKFGIQEHNDYYYLGCPWVNHRIFSFLDVPWRSRDKKKEDVMIDETMTMQASLWFMTIEHFHKRLEDLDVRRWGTWSAEQQEISLKTWLCGGKMMINKNVYNAHYERLMEERVVLNPEYTRRDEGFTRKALCYFFLNKRWKQQKRTVYWLIERFWPLPTPKTRIYREKYPWPEDWREYYKKHYVYE